MQMPHPMQRSVSMTGRRCDIDNAPTPGGQRSAQAPHSGPAKGRQSLSTIRALPTEQTSGLSGTTRAPSAQADAQGKPSHMWQALCSGRITGVPASTPSTKTKTAPYGQASEQAPQRVQSAWKSGSGTQPGGLDWLGNDRLIRRSTAPAVASRAAGPSWPSHWRRVKFATPCSPCRCFPES